MPLAAIAGINWIGTRTVSPVELGGLLERMSRGDYRATQLFFAGCMSRFAPEEAVDMLAQVFEEGIKGDREPRDWRDKGLTYSEALDWIIPSLCRHFVLGDLPDPDSGCPHIMHAAARALILIDIMETKENAD